MTQKTPTQMARIENGYRLALLGTGCPKKLATEAAKVLVAGVPKTPAHKALIDRAWAAITQ